MKKYMILTGLLLSASLLLAACRPGTGPGTGTEPDTAGDEPTGTADGTSAEVPTRPSDDGPWTDLFEREDPRAGFTAWLLDGFTLNEEAYFDTDGRADTLLAAADDTVAFRLGGVHDTVSFGGWIGFDQPIDRFGYRVDGGRCVFGDFAAPTETEAKNAGGRFASRFSITAPLYDQAVGPHTVSALVRLADGKIVCMYEVTAVIRSYTADPDRAYHSVTDRVNGAGSGGAAALTGVSASTLSGDGSCPEVTDVQPVGPDCLLFAEGLIGLSGGVDKYVWTADGVRWYDCVDLGTSDVDISRLQGLGVPDASPGKAAYRIGADLSSFGGKIVSVTFAAVCAAAPDVIAPLVRVTDVYAPVKPVDIGWSFRAEAASSEVGIDLTRSELAEVFGFSYGASGPHDVEQEGNEKYYMFCGINDMAATVNGCNAFTVDVRYNPDVGAMMFTRGVRVVHPIDTTGIQIVMGSYYETDWAGFMGGAGIWCQLSGGKLTVVIKYYDASATARIGNKVYEFPASGSKLTLADDGGTVYVLVDGRLITKITLSGEVRYPDMTWSAEAAGFVARATIVKADGSFDVVTNTLIADAPSQVGIAVRPSPIAFRSVEIVPFSAVTIPTK
ncbi:MAG: hypothetical protein MJ192_01860 [Clostridia bacterium]|nr:hypothetical protein [Clostridia bacterium]